MDLYAQIADKIIKEQQAIIGPIAYEQARKVAGLKVGDSREIVLQGNEKEIIEKLVEQYKHLFGQTSVEVCKEAIRGIDISSDKLPALLK